MMMPLMVMAESSTAQLQKELKQANDIVKLMQKQYKELQQRNSELEKENAYLGNQLILREAEIQFLNANYGKPSNNTALNAAQAAAAQAGGNVQADNRAIPPTPQVTRPKPANVADIGKLTPVRDLTLYVDTGGAELHTGPGTNFPRLLRLQEGVLLNVDAKRDDWYRVLTIGGIIGFVHKKYTTKTKPALPEPDANQEAF